MTDIILTSFVFLSTLAYGVGDPSQNLTWSLAKFNIFFLHIGAIALYCASIKSQPVRNIKPKLAFALLGIGGLNLIFTQFEPLVMSSLLNVFFWVMGLYIAVNYIEDTERLRNFMVWAVIINIYAFLFQKFGWNPILNDRLTTGEEGGIMGNLSCLATYIAIMLPFLPWQGTIFGLILGITGKEIGLLVACVIVVFFKLYRWKNRNKKKIIATLLSLVVAFLVIDYFEIIRTHIFETLFNVSIANRLPIWKGLTEMVFQSPWIGYGLGARPIYMTGPNEALRMDYAFSSILQFIFGVGFIGAAWIGIGLVEFKKRFNYSRESIAILIFIALSIFKYPVEIHRLWFTLLAIFAIWIIQTETEDLLCG